MTELEQINFSERKKLDREYLKVMAKDMVRKDFELIRIQDHFLKVFSEVEFFSKHNDDLSSIEHCLELALGEVLEEIMVDNYWALVCESGVALAFDYKREFKDQVNIIEQISETLVDLIFAASEQKNEIEKQKFFIEGFEQNYPHLKIPYVDIRKLEIGNEFICELNQ